MDQALTHHQDLGLLKVRATLTIGNYLAVGLMAQFKARQSSARVQLKVANTQTIVDQVLNFELDLGMIEGEINHPDLDIQRWRGDTLVAFCAPDHPLARIKTLNDQHLLEAQWIVRESGSGTRQTFERGMHGIWSDLTIELELEHTEAIKRAVEAGLGVSCLSHVSLQEAFKRGTLVPLAIPDRDFSRDFYLVLHRQKYRSPGIQAWLELCQAGNDRD